MTNVSSKSKSTKITFGDGPKYWDQRYLKKPEPYEWLEVFEDLRHILEDATDNDKTRRILNIGCGNSLITEDMYDNGYENIVNVDNSSVVINQMKQRNYGMREGMKWMVGDAMKMRFKDGSFDLILDKGLLDDFHCNVNSDVLIDTLLKEVRRVLRDDGVYLCVTFGEKMNYMESPHLEWKTRIIELPLRRANCHFVYFCRAQASRKASSWWWWPHLQGCFLIACSLIVAQWIHHSDMFSG